MLKCGHSHCLLRLPRFRVLVVVLHQLLRLTNQRHNQVNLFLCRTITTTAHAISRALAESLSSLLSSLQDSSGGNANMAATSDHSSGPSNSTHYPASSSSGTPCSTSQSSGTLVVPLIISTYISFDGPSVVSTLPAMSSANLPVRVGGSYGGATGSVSSTLPSLDKAFVVGPGYAQALYKFFSKNFSRAFCRPGRPTSRQY